RDKTILEEYWGLWSAMHSKPSLWPVDSVIHALGNVRGIAKATIPSADLVTSTRYWISPEWQPWNLSQNFWFYEPLFSNWEPIFFSPTTVVWKKLDSARTEDKISCDVLTDKDGFALSAAKANEFYKVNLHYQIQAKGRHLFM